MRLHHQSIFAILAMLALLAIPLHATAQEAGKRAIVVQGKLTDAETGEIRYARLFRENDGGRPELSGGFETGEIIADSQAEDGPIITARFIGATNDTFQMKANSNGGEASLQLQHVNGVPSISLHSDSVGGSIVIGD